jgi:micrococcal nuclease
MSTSTKHDEKLSYDLNSSRVVRLWLALEIILTLICLMLFFSLPKTAGGLFFVICSAFVLTIGAALILFIRYNLLPIVKNKQSYLTDRTKLLNKISTTKMELGKVEQSLATNQTNESQEIERALQKIHKDYIESGLRAAKIENSNIQGVGPKLKEKLKTNGIISAADIGLHIQNLEGFGTAKVQALMGWKETVLAQLESTKPDRLPDAQLSEIQQKHKRQKDNLIKARESHQLKLTELGLELDTVNRNLAHFKSVNFINYLSVDLLGNIKNKTLQKNGTMVVIVVIGLGALVHGVFGMISSGALIVASRPTPTLTVTPTMTFTAIPTSTNTRTPTPKPTSTITASPTATITPTVTLTPSMTYTPTEDLSFYNVAACIPKNTSVQKGKVVQVVDGDTIHVLLEDGNTYTVRYLGMNTPESGRPYYTESTSANSEMVFQKNVILIKDVSETDQYDRLLRYVIVGNKFVNLELVKTGFAEAETFPPDVACADTFVAAQSEAFASQLGLWTATQTPIPSAPEVIIVTVNKVAEYVDIKNTGNVDVDLSGWNLVSERGNQGCPLSGIIKVGETLRIWAGTAQGGGFSCGYSRPIWNNSESDPAVLYNAQGVEVSRK